MGWFEGGRVLRPLLFVQGISTMFVRLRLPPRVPYRILHYCKHTRYLDIQHLQSCKSLQQTQHSEKL
jgi:hypothetical protein